MDQALLNQLPHGKAFLFLDRLEELEPGGSAVATYAVRGDESFLEGHFPHQPMMPGVILIEALAQLGGVIAQSATGSDPAAQLRLTAVRNAKILGTAVPGETLQVKARLLASLGGLAQVEGEIRVPERDITILKATVVLTSTANR